MRCAIVDMGSNSVRLSVYDYEKKTILPVFQKRETAGLAGYVKNRVLTKEGIRRACGALAEVIRAASDFHPENTGVFATASLRGLTNQQEVLDAIFHETGIHPEILTGEEEARLDFLGIRQSCPLEKGMLADIGGGSTELLCFDAEGPHRMVSMPIGSLYLNTRWVKGLIPNSDEIAFMRQEIRQKLEALPWENTGDLCRMVCGIGGTMRMMQRLAKELLGQDRPYFTGEDADRIWEIAGNEDPAVSKSAYRICPERMFSMVPGILVVQEIGRHFSCEKFYISETGIREGYLLDRFGEK